MYSHQHASYCDPLLKFPCTETSDQTENLHQRAVTTEASHQLISRPLTIQAALNIAGNIKDLLTTDPDSVICAIRQDDILNGWLGVFEHDVAHVWLKQDGKQHFSVRYDEIQDKIFKLGEKKWRGRLVVGTAIIGCILAGQIYATFLMKDDARQLLGWHRGEGILVGLVNFAVSAGVGIGMKMMFNMLKPQSAREARQFLTTSAYDKIVMDKLPNMYGYLETIVVLGFCTLILNFVVIGIFTQDAGSVAFGHILAGYMITLVSSLASEPSSLQTIRRRVMLEAMESRAALTGLMCSGIDPSGSHVVDKARLKQEFDDFLAHPVHQDTMVITSTFLILLLATFNLPGAASIRIRRFVVKNYKYFDNDAVVDVFDESITFLERVPSSANGEDTNEGRVYWDMGILGYRGPGEYGEWLVSVPVHGTAVPVDIKGLANWFGMHGLEAVTTKFQVCLNPETIYMGQYTSSHYFTS